ncbi:MAG: hypothetical protein A2538_03555 [Candidatus Magasanikbacteria bacterium RIFOXYD2_FULL_41_14]|uniref:Epoxyqueuosine reductase QueH n=1 Tax=Candidatus Magasanikbacteria bacterium RIFOXYD2_FULL_41_14 TaxID=1798709 RepID=A0A1F6PCL6_9BACT|nr:MAG: hypothetical protein A2538_03555 [Candidatus Magasanikbacteria bacterium RIFOXYD2_FULL_41_14]
MQKFLLHTCCAPCGIVVIDELRQKYNLTVFFYNPNIYPEEEYLKRKAEVVKLCIEWGVPMVDNDYENDKWQKDVADGLETEPEGGLRCPLCFKMRLAQAAEYAAKNGFEIYGTTITSGRNKLAAIINPIGQSFAKYYKIKFYSEDWKKGGRQEKSNQMVAERGIYRQNYCGCKYSRRLKIED